MAYTPTRLYQGQPGTSVVTLYTVPVNNNCIVKQIVLANVTASEAIITLSFVPSGQSAGVTNRIVPGVAIPGNSIVTIDLSQVLNSGDFISGLQGTSGAITVTISGVVIN